MVDKHSTDGSPQARPDPADVSSLDADGHSPGWRWSPGSFQMFMAFRDHCEKTGDYHALNSIRNWLKWNS